MIKKRGTFLGEQNVAELDNAMIEEHLGKFNVLCLEDIIFEIQKCGKNAATVEPMQKGNPYQKESSLKTQIFSKIPLVKTV